MNYNLYNTNLLSNMYSMSGLNSGSLTPQLFSGVDGLSVFSNMPYGYGSSQTFRGKPVSGSFNLAGAIGLTVGGILTTIAAGVGIKALNDNSAQKRADEAEKTKIDNLRDTVTENKTKLDEQLGKIGVTSSAELVKRDEIVNAKFDSKVYDAEIDRINGNIASLKGDIAGLQNKINTLNNDKSKDNSEEIKKLTTELTTKEQELKDAEAKKQTEVGKKTAAENEFTDAQTKALELYDQIKSDEAKIDAYDKAQEQKDFCKDIDNADGTAVSRLFGAHEAKVKNGVVEGDIDKFDDNDLQKILANWRKGSSAEKEKIEKWLKDNKDKINAKTITKEHVREYLHKICSDINIDNP